jgi:hypothetical protein
LISNYQQKRNKPNSGYNYTGLAVRMAMGLGLHKEFQDWNISPLKMEIRRRVWWTLCILDIWSYHHIWQATFMARRWNLGCISHERQ